MYHDVPVVVNISGRFALDQGIDGRLGKNFMQRIKKDGYIDVRNKKGVCLLPSVWHLFR
jgi:solute carrier family 25 (adenine nucleotide translocator) protein 4/5/6/31